MPVVKTSAKGQIVIPKEIREKLGITPGKRILLRLVDEHAEITPLPDDVGTKSLKTENTGAGGAKTVSEISPYPKIHPAQSSVGEELAEGSLRRRNRESFVMRRSTERRGPDRRQRDINVPLDTRSEQERRKENRRDEDTRTTRRGVDTYS